MSYLKTLFKSHPLFSWSVTILSTIIIYNLLLSSVSGKNKVTQTTVSLQCEYIDTGLEGFSFKYDEPNKTIYYGGKNTVVKDLIFSENKITFKVIDGNYSTEYEFDKGTRLFKMVKDSSGLEKVKVGKIFCKNSDEIRADKEKESKEMDEAWSIYSKLKLSVRANLKDPDSAKWDSPYVTARQVCVTVNAKNSFGAYVGKVSYCAKKNSKNEWNFQN